VSQDDTFTDIAVQVTLHDTVNHGISRGNAAGEVVQCIYLMLASPPRSELLGFLRLADRDTCSDQ